MDTAPTPGSLVGFLHVDGCQPDIERTRYEERGHERLGK